jgi:hypothetical protein
MNPTPKTQPDLPTPKAAEADQKPVKANPAKPGKAWYKVLSGFWFNDGMTIVGSKVQLSSDEAEHAGPTHVQEIADES